MSTQHYSVDRLRKATIHFFGGRLIQAVASAVLLLVVVRLLSLEDYGAYMVMLGFVELIGPLSSMGFVEAGQRFVPQAVKHGRSCVQRLLIVLVAARFTVLVLLAIGVWLLWPLLVPVFHFNEIHAAQRDWLLALMVFVLSFRFFAELLECLLEQAWSQALRSLLPLLKLAAIAALWLSGNEIDLEQLLALESLSAAVCLILAALVLTKKANTLQKGDRDRFELAQIWRFAWHMAGVRWLNSTTNPGMIRLVVAGFMGLEQAGLFGFLQTLVSLLNQYLPIWVLRGLVRPVLISRFMQKGGEAILNSSAGLLWKSNLILVGMIAVIAYASGNELLALASGDKYTGVGLVFVVWMIFLASQSQTHVLEMVMQITGHTAELRRIALFAPVILICIWLAAHYGIYSVVIMLGVTSIVRNMFALRLFHRSYSAFHLDWQGGVNILISVVLSLIAVHLVSMVAPGLAIVVACSVFLSSLMVLRPLAHDEMEIIQKGVGARLARPLNILVRSQ